MLHFAFACRILLRGDVSRRRRWRRPNCSCLGDGGSFADLLLAAIIDAYHAELALGHDVL